MTSRSGFSGEGGVVSQGSRALRPKSPDTLATGTTLLPVEAEAETEAMANAAIEPPSERCKLISKY